MAEFPSLPLFTDAFIADTIHLDAQQTGAYMMLLMSAWRSPDCRLPDDDKKLARFARCTTRQWSKIKDEVMAFWTLNDGWWEQKRLLKERVHVTKVAEQRSKAGSQGGRPKSLKNNETDKAKGYSPLKQNESKPKAPTPTPILKEEGKPSSKRASPAKGSRLPDDWWPSVSDQAYATGQGLDPPIIQREAEKFRNYWHAKSGKDATKLDWSKTWQNWCINAAERKPANTPSPTNQGGIMEVARRQQAKYGAMQ